MNQEQKLGQQASYNKQYYVQGLWCPGCAKNLGVALDKRFPNETNVVDYSSGLIESTICDFKLLSKSINQLGYKATEIVNIKQYQETQQREYITQIRNLILSFWTMMWLILLNLTVTNGLNLSAAFTLNILFMLFITPSLLHSLKIGFKSFINGYPNIDTLISLVFVATLILAFLSFHRDYNDFYFDSFAMNFFVLNLVRFLEFKYSRKPVLNQEINSLIANSFYMTCKKIEMNGSLKLKKVMNLKSGMFIKLTRGDLAPANIKIVSSSQLKISTENINGEKDSSTPRVDDIILYGSIVYSGELLGRIESFNQNSFAPAIKSLRKQQSIRVGKYENIIINSFWFLISFGSIGASISYVANNNAYDAVKVFALFLVSLNVCVFYLVPNIYDLVTKRVTGIYFSSKNFLLRYGEVESFIFDKTGTLEKNQGKIEIIKNSTNRKPRAIYALLGAIEEGIHHPIAQVIAENNQIDGIASEVLLSRRIHEDRIEVTDKNKVEWTFGKRNKEGNLLLTSTHGACTVSIDLYKDERIINYLKELISEKQDVHILTGDSKKNLQTFLDQIGLDSSSKFISSMTASDKAEYIKKLGTKCLVFADGVNDIEMVNQAYLSIAMPHSVSNLKLVSDAFLSHKKISHNELVQLERSLIKNTKYSTILIGLMYIALTYLILNMKINSTLVIISMLTTTLLVICSPMLELKTKPPK